MSVLPCFSAVSAKAIVSAREGARGFRDEDVIPCSECFKHKRLSWVGSHADDDSFEVFLFKHFVPIGVVSTRAKFASGVFCTVFVGIANGLQCDRGEM